MDATIMGMKKIIQNQYGGPDVLELVQTPTPTPGPGEVLIDVVAAGVNPIDVVVRGREYRPRDGQSDQVVALPFDFLGTPPFTVGWDVAGVVASAGPGVTQFAPGDEVLGLVAFPEAASAYADHVVASTNELVSKPAALTMQQAGALPLAGLTAWQALAGIAQVGPGQRVLIHAAAGGVGHFAVQIAKARGAYVIGTASATKHDFVRSLGADEVIDYRTTRFEDVVDPVDIVLELVGGNYAERSATVLVPGGWLIASVGIYLGITPERATELGIRFGYVDVRPSAADLRQLLQLVEKGQLTVHIDHAIPLAEAARAHDLLASGHATGKIVLEP